MKLIRDKNSGQLQGYGFVEFTSRAAAERVLQTYNGQMMPNVELTFRLNWASAGEKRDDTPDYTIFVGGFGCRCYILLVTRDIQGSLSLGEGCRSCD